MGRRVIGWIARSDAVLVVRDELGWMGMALGGGCGGRRRGG